MNRFTVCFRLAVLRLATVPFPVLAILALAPGAFAQQGAISGAVVDPSGASVARAQVRLLLDGRAPDREMQSADSGEFSFQNVDAGP